MVCIGGTDYNGGRFNACFPIGALDTSFNVTFINDDEPPIEMDEQFEIHFVSTEQNIMVEVFATVTIPEVCTLVCQNGGTRDDTTCECICPTNYTGLLCQGEPFTYGMYVNEYML